jgi:Arc/MetJ-type ribon-helix-helix transcriptional regulator
VPERPPKRRGRPPIDPDDPSVTLNVRLPSHQFDQLCHRAHAGRRGVSEVVRALVKSWLRQDDEK